MACMASFSSSHLGGLGGLSTLLAASTSGGVSLPLGNDLLGSYFGFGLPLCRGVRGLRSHVRVWSRVDGLYKEAAGQAGLIPRGWKRLFREETVFLLWCVKGQ
jgi:hypothetical protein